MRDRRRTIPPSEAPHQFPQMQYHRPLDHLAETLPLQSFIEHHLGRAEPADSYNPEEMGVIAVNPFIP